MTTDTSEKDLANLVLDELTERGRLSGAAHDYDRENLSRFSALHR